VKMCYTYIRRDKYLLIGINLEVIMKLSNYIKLLALTLVCAVFLCACSGEEQTSSEISSVPETEESGQAKVGYIYNDPVSSDNMTAMFEKSRYDMQVALEIETCYVDNVPVSSFDDAVTALKNEGCQIIVSASRAFANSAYSYARKDKDVYILSYGGETSLSNLISFQPKIYQPAFVCGAAAAWNSSSRKIGVVADDTMFLSDAVIDAFVLGVQEIYKANETDVRVYYANTAEETQQAIDALKDYGCDVVFSYQSSDYAMYYSDNLGIASIGFTSDINYPAPKKGLMGFYLSWGTYITDAVSECINDRFESQVFVGGINEAFVKVTPYSDNVREQTQTICDTLYDYVKKGHAKIFEGEIRDKDGRTRVALDTVLTYEQIKEIDYLLFGVTYTENLIRPVANPPQSDFVVKNEFVN